MEHFCKLRPTEASEMFHFSKMPERAVFTGFLVDEFKTVDKPIRYGKNNQYTYSDRPTAIGQGSERKINIYCVVPEAA